ncbi:neuroguidin isoform X2 [Macaca nemestrina]|uniref:neuroguidin isoform X2 n=1 Tax=Macaca nemestrina TaxID=9545 RepID=UPI0039B8E7F2
MAAPGVLESDLPSAVTLLKNLQEQVMTITAQVQSLTQKVQAGAYPTEKGLSFLEVKDQLLLMYLMDLTHLILDKASGGSLQGHDGVLRLVEIRTVLEKLRPLDQKLKYQIDKLVKTAVTGSLSENDPLRFKPHPSNMMSKLSSEDEEEDEVEDGQSEASGKKSVKGVSKKYVPPRLVPVHYDETEAEREKKRLERAKRRALSSSVIRELKEQYSDAPEEIRDAQHPHVTRQSQEDQHRIRILLRSGRRYLRKVGRKKVFGGGGDYGCTYLSIFCHPEILLISLYIGCFPWNSLIVCVGHVERTLLIKLILLMN